MEPVIVQSPRLKNAFLRLLVGVVAIMGAMLSAQIGVRAALKMVVFAPAQVNMVVNLVGALLSFVAYKLIMGYLERRKVTELSEEGLFFNLGLGTVVGGMLQSLVIGILFISGMYTVVGVNGLDALLPGFVIALISGVGEEILFRGVLFRLIEESLGSIIALTITSLLFGAAHLANPNATIFSAAAISIEAGILLGAAYMYTRSLWLPIAIHFSWNFAESGVFGTALSGVEIGKTFITSKMEGPAILTGGAFGPENSIIALCLCLAAGSAFLAGAVKKQQLIQPFWKRPKPQVRVVDIEQAGLPT